jgi:DNA-binding NarL/FixJ family response regulator
VVDAIGDARADFERGSWGDAYRRLVLLDSGEALEPDDLDRFATAAYLTGRDEQAFELWTRAHQRGAEQGDVPRAVWFGVRLASALGFKGDIARSAGWVERSRRLLDRSGLECVELGYLAHASAMCRIFESGDLAGAHALFVESGKIGATYGDRELVTLARIGEGRMLVYFGELAEGVALLDEAMVAVEAGEIPPIAIGDAYCTAIDACTELFDLARGRAWTASFTRWCDDQQDLRLYRGHCLLHRAELMVVDGEGDIAVDEARRACGYLADPVNHLTLGGAHYIEGELHRLRGQFAEAETSYRLADEHGAEPQPGLALLRLAQGRVDRAAASIRRALDETEGAVFRARMLGPYVEIMLAAGDIEAARAGSDELAAVAVDLGSPLLQAQAAQFDGAVQIAEQDPKGALRALRRARRAFVELVAPHEVARTRMLIATACEAIGDEDGADLERGAARAALARLGARPDLAHLDAGSGPPVPDGLTPREVEVLCVLARGRTNRVIAEELFISEKTVASHVSHIFTKLGVTSRAAATAYAYDHDLVSPTS